MANCKPRTFALGYWRWGNCGEDGDYEAPTRFVQLRMLIWARESIIDGGGGWVIIYDCIWLGGSCSDRQPIRNWQHFCLFISPIYTLFRTTLLQRKKMGFRLGKPNCFGYLKWVKYMQLFLYKLLLLMQLSIKHDLSHTSRQIYSKIINIHAAVESKHQ